MASQHALRAMMINRLGHACQRCLVTVHVELSHIVPKHKGGTDDPENLSLLCGNCHTGWHWAEEHGWEWAFWVRCSPDIKHDEWLTTAEAGVLLGVNASRVRQMIRERRFAAYPLTERTLIVHRAEIEKYKAGLAFVTGRRGPRANVAKDGGPPPRQPGSGEEAP